MPATQPRTPLYRHTITFVTDVPSDWTLADVRLHWHYFGGEGVYRVTASGLGAGYASVTLHVESLDSDLADFLDHLHRARGPYIVEDVRTRTVKARVSYTRDEEAAKNRVQPPRTKKDRTMPSD